MFNLFKKAEKEPQNIEEILKELRSVKKSHEFLLEELKKINAESQLHFKKFGFVRYNPFSGVGSDQSFSLALLTDKNDGVIITSLFSREGNRVYAKTITAGNANYALSEEEGKALTQALEEKQNG